MINTTENLNVLLMESAKEIFETMIFMDLGEVTEQGSEVDGWALLGSITFKGDVEGCLTICCCSECAKTITMNMLGLDSIDDVSEEDTCDAIGEVTNMIMGCVKRQLTDNQGKSIEISIPTVVNGRQLSSNLGEGVERVSTKVCIEDKYIAELSLLYKSKS